MPKKKIFPQRLVLCLCACMGVLAFLVIYGPAPLDPTADAWLLAGYDEGDITQHYAGWLAFRNSPWAMPLFGAPHRPIAFGSHKSLRKRLRGYVLTGLLLLGKTEQPEINTAGESVDS